MNSDPPRMLVLRRTAWISTFLVLCIIGFSATIRLSAAGLGCEPWPQCYGQPAATPHAFGTELLRVLHRVAAVVLLPLLLMLIMGGFAPRPQRWPQRWTAVMAVAVAIFLAVLGRWTAGARVPAIALGNLLGGFVLLALCLRMALVGSAPWQTPALAARTARWRALALVLILLQVALGGLVSSSYAGLACTGPSGCALASEMPWQALDPWRLPPVDSASWPTHPEGVLLQLLHRGTALLTVTAVVITAILLRRDGRPRLAGLLLALLALEVSLAALLVLQGLPLVAAVAHNLTAALLLALLFALP